MEDIEQLLSSLKAKPFDEGLLNVLADVYEEEGEDTRAEALRACSQGRGRKAYEAVTKLDKLYADVIKRHSDALVGGAFDDAGVLVDQLLDVMKDPEKMLRVVGFESNLWIVDSLESLSKRFYQLFSGKASHDLYIVVLQGDRGSMITAYRDPKRDGFKNYEWPAASRPVTVVGPLFPEELLKPIRELYFELKDERPSPKMSKVFKT